MGRSSYRNRLGEWWNSDTGTWQRKGFDPARPVCSRLRDEEGALLSEYQRGWLSRHDKAGTESGRVCAYEQEARNRRKRNSRYIAGSLEALRDGSPRYQNWREDVAAGLLDENSDIERDSSGSGGAGDLRSPDDFAAGCSVEEAVEKAAARLGYSGVLEQWHVPERPVHVAEALPASVLLARCRAQFRDRYGLKAYERLSEED